MAEEFVDPSGDRLRIQRSTPDVLELEASYKPHSSRPPLHYHPYQEEHFEVLAGKFLTQIGDEQHTYAQGERFVVPPDTPHWMHNVSDRQGVLRWQIRPALKSEAFFTTMWGLADDGKVGSNGLPNLLQLAVILNAYRNEFRAVKPPYWVQRMLFAPLALIGRLIGYKAVYRRSSERSAP